MNFLKNIHVAYIFMQHIYAYINLSYMIVNLVCIINSHHCAIFIISIEFIHSVITMYDM